MAKQRKQIKYAVVGLGHIAQVAVLPAFAHAGRNSVPGALVSDDRTKRHRIGRKYGIEKTFSYAEYDSCLEQVDAVYIRGHEPPDMIVFRGQFYLEDDLKFTFEPFTEGMSSADPRDLTADPFGKQSPRIFDALKPFEGQMVSIRFPKDDDGTEHGGYEAVLQEITPHYVKLHVPKLVINFPEWHKSIVGATPSFQPLNNKSDPVANQKNNPSYEKSIALDFLNLEEDVEKKRPRLVIDYSHWESRF